MNYGHLLSNKFKLQTGFIMTAVLVATVPFLSNYLNHDAAFYAVFVVLCLFGLVNGMTQGTVFGSAGILPPKYTGVIMSGNGLAGILSGIINLIILLIVPKKGFGDALVFFGILIAILIGCAIGFPYCIETDFYKYYEE
jgi:equilibrative nucleoside transporter 1/2/3